MKNMSTRIISFFFAIVIMICSMNSCQSVPANSIAAPVTTSVPKTTTAPATTQKVEDKSNWTLRYYVDNFGNEMKDKKFLQFTTHNGTFSNSATTNSKLSVRVTVDENNLYIYLAEYGNNVVKNASSSSILYTIEVLDGNGTTHKLNGLLGSDSDRIFCWKNNSGDWVIDHSLINILKKGGIVSIYMYPTDRKIQNYSFKIDANGFSEAYKKL